MGGVFFFLFLGILFVVALLFIAASTIIIIIWNVRKRSGKAPRKRWLVIPLIVLALSVIVALLPAGFLGFLRYANSSAAVDAVYAESGVMLYWPYDERNHTTRDRFELDGTGYIPLREDFSDEPFFPSYDDDNLGDPVANIQSDPATRKPFNEFMTFLLSGSTNEQSEVSAIYPIENSNGFPLYAIKGSSGSGVFCSEIERDNIISYYRDISNYNTQNPICEYSVYTSGEVTGERNDTPYITIESEITMDDGVFEKLQRIYDEKHGFERVEIPQECIARAEAALPDTPINGYENRELIVYSNDNMAYQHVILSLIENQVYIKTVSGAGYFEGYPLAEALNRYIIDTVFS